MTHNQMGGYVCGMLPPRADVVEAFRQTLAEELSSVAAVAAMARDEASSEETRSEGKYDTRATEASYLARGQAERVVALGQLLSWFEQLRADAPPAEVVQLGALVALDGDRPAVVFIAPAGGPQVTVGGVRVQAISMTSPLGAAMRGLEAEDAFELVTPRGVRDMAISALV
jgi:transcription elongation GreA/GreB family factor